MLHTSHPLANSFPWLMNANHGHVLGHIPIENNTSPNISLSTVITPEVENSPDTASVKYVRWRPHQICWCPHEETVFPQVRRGGVQITRCVDIERTSTGNALTTEAMHQSCSA